MVYESDEVVCFFPLEPELLGHTLVCSRIHYEDIRDTPSKLGASIFAATQKLSIHYGKELGTTAFNLMNASGKDAEQSVPHLHFHYLPRFDSDEYSTWPRLPGFKTDLDRLHLRLKLK